MDMFDAPSSGVKITDLEGRLLLVFPTEHREAIQTSFGPADAVIADVVVLDGPDSPKKEYGVMLFQKKLQGQTRPKVGTGRAVLGRLGKGIAKAGQSAPWQLKDPTPAEADTARRYLANDLVTTPAANVAEETPPF